jgi:hypothetical protein
MGGVLDSHHVGHQMVTVLEGGGDQVAPSRRAGQRGVPAARHDAGRAGRQGGCTPQGGDEGCQLPVRCRRVLTPADRREAREGAARCIRQGCRLRVQGPRCGYQLMRGAQRERAAPVPAQLRRRGRLHGVGDAGMRRCQANQPAVGCIRPGGAQAARRQFHISCSILQPLAGVEGASRSMLLSASTVPPRPGNQMECQGQYCSYAHC